jgi:hypothetical protein
MNIISDAEIRRLGEAYLAGKNEGDSRSVRSMTAAYADKVQRDFRRLTKKIDIIFVDRDPYQNFGELEHDVLVNRRMFVYAGFSVVPWWSPEINMMGRAIHDFDHVKVRAQFAVHDEIRAFQHAVNESPLLEPLLMSEIALQTASTTLLDGKFDDVQRIVLPDHDIAQIARRRLNPERRALKRDVMMAWDAAGALRYMSAADAMRLMGARGVPMEKALVAIAAAKALDAPPLAARRGRARRR